MVIAYLTDNAIVGLKSAGNWWTGTIRMWDIVRLPVITDYSDLRKNIIAWHQTTLAKPLTANFKSSITGHRVIAKWEGIPIKVDFISRHPNVNVLHSILNAELFLNLAQVEGNKSSFSINWLVHVHSSQFGTTSVSLLWDSYFVLKGICHRLLNKKYVVL